MKKAIHVKRSDRDGGRGGGVTDEAETSYIE